MEVLRQREADRAVAKKLTSRRLFHLGRVDDEVVVVPVAAVDNEITFAYLKFAARLPPFPRSCYHKK